MASGDITNATSQKRKQYTLIWLDSDVKKNETSMDLEKDLRNMFNTVEIFEKEDKCEEYIKRMIDRRIILIVSGMLGSKLVPRVHELKQVRNVVAIAADLRRRLGGLVWDDEQLQKVST
ncbi:unnamed protein product, partial [Didymodactylos carnosus]